MSVRQGHSRSSCCESAPSGGSWRRRPRCPGARPRAAGLGVAGKRQMGEWSIGAVGHLQAHGGQNIRMGRGGGHHPRQAWVMDRCLQPFSSLLEAVGRLLVFPLPVCNNNSAVRATRIRANPGFYPRRKVASPAPTSSTMPIQASALGTSPTPVIRSPTQRSATRNGKGPPR